MTHKNTIGIGFSGLFIVIRRIYRVFGVTLRYAFPQQVLLRLNI